MKTASKYEPHLLRYVHQPCHALEGLGNRLATMSGDPSLPQDTSPPRFKRESSARERTLLREPTRTPKSTGPTPTRGGAVDDESHRSNHRRYTRLRPDTNPGNESDISDDQGTNTVHAISK